MRKMAVSLSKGGVGKSTTALSLAHGLALKGSRVLLVDTDTQGQISRMLHLQPKAGLAELISGEASPDEAITEARDRLHILAGGRSLAGVKREISRQDYGSEKVLTEALAGYQSRYDFCVLDTPPSWDSMSVNVLFYAEEVLAPVALEALAIYGLVDFEESLQAIQKYHQVELRYILPTFMDGRVRKSKEILDQIRHRYGKLACQPIRYSVRLSECAGLGQSIYEYAPASHGAEDYKQLVRRIRKDGH